MKAMVRINNLRLSGTGQKTLESMEKHGKRLDKTSRDRMVRDVDPVVYGTLDLRTAYDGHVKDCRMNKSVNTPVQHALIKFPDNINPTLENQEKMLNVAVKFINETHGGKAVFAARLDRDEAGQHNVDVFFAPKYTKQTKNRKKEAVFTDWISTSKFGKELCEKHREEIMSRNDEGKFTTTPRSTGIALQAELSDFLTRHGLKLEPRTIKMGYLSDRLETEAYKRVRDEEHRANARFDVAEDAIEKQRAELKAEIEEERAKLLIEKAAHALERGKLVRLAERLLTACKVLSECLHIKLPASLQDAVDAIEETVSQVSIEEPSEDTSFSI